MLYQNFGGHWNNNMERGSLNHKKSAASENDSLGILCMDNLKAFGEISDNASMYGSNGRISDRLNVERLKAFETLKKFESSKKSTSSSSNKENVRVSSSFNQTPSSCEKSDYVPYRQPKSINISDLITDETINLENSSSIQETGRNKDFHEQNISFEPNEMTARSTLFKGNHQQSKKSASSRVSVADILASSLSKKARDLSETLRSNDNSMRSYEDPNDVRRSSTRSSCSSFTYNGIHSLPRTADLSVSKPSLSDLSINGGDGFSFTSGVIEGNSIIGNEKFAPSELMMDKLLLDEIAWADQYAAIPKATLSKQAKEKANCTESMIGKNLDNTNLVNSLMGDHNFSVGTFFNMRSEDIRNIVKSKSPDKCRTPIPLVDQDDTLGNTTSPSAHSSNDVEATPKVDNKTYTKIKTPATSKREKPEVDRDSKDSGRESQNSFLLSMSAIDRALCDLNIETDHSDISVIKQVLSNARKLRTPEIKVTTAEKSPRKESISSIAELLSENKENVDPEVMRRGTLNDTLDFTESLLNSSDMKRGNYSNNSLQRSPLTHLNLSNPQIHLISAEPTGNEADEDEWPSTPVKPSHRRVRKTKSPHDKAEIKNLNPNTDVSSTSTQAKTPTSRSERSQPKSLCSTRLEGDKHASIESEFGISPSLVQSNNTNINGNIGTDVLPTTPTLRKSVLTVGSTGKMFEKRSPSKQHLVSPLSSPRSGVSSPSVNGCQSPHLDSTTISEQRVLTAGNLTKAASSPVASDSGNSNCGAVSARSYSSASIRNSNLAGRSMSRCSNSSEFSHRDGKVIPLKVTTLELSWGSTKLRTESRKVMQVKNISNKRLVVRLEISGPGFQIANMQSSSLTLQSQECRSIAVNFCPTVTGTAIGFLSFFSPLGTTTVSTPFLEIPLYAYGGHATIIPLNIFKGPVGSAFMTMGEVYELAQPLEKTFEIFNKGPLIGFASVTVDSLGLMMPRLSDTFEVNPASMLIPPGKSVRVKVVFKPRREDIKKILKKIQHVFTLANMRIICGDEANRQRVRRLLHSLTSEERAKISSNTLDKLWESFPNEVEMTELNEFKEKPTVIMDLITCMRNQEIVLTINCENMDDTFESSSIFFPDADDTVLFRTICAASPGPPQCNSLEPVDEVHETTINEGSNVLGSSNDVSWFVYPNILHIDFKGKEPLSNYNLTIQNNYKSRQYFEVASNRKNLFSFTPSEGYVSPDGGQTKVEVRILNEFRLFQEYCRNEDISIMVNIENESIVVPIKSLK